MFSLSRYKGKRKAAGDRSRRFHVRIFYTTNLYLPTGNLDSRTSQDVLGLMKISGQKLAQTIVMITHNDEIAQMADRIIRLEDGRIVKGGE